MSKYFLIFLILPSTVFATNNPNLLQSAQLLSLAVKIFYENAYQVSPSPKQILATNLDTNGVSIKYTSISGECRTELISVFLDKNGKATTYSLPLPPSEICK